MSKKFKLGQRVEVIGDEIDITTGTIVGTATVVNHSQYSINGINNDIVTLYAVKLDRHCAGYLHRGVSVFDSPENRAKHGYGGYISTILAHPDNIIKLDN